MNKKLFLVILNILSAVCLRADDQSSRATHAGIPRYFGMTKDNQKLYVTNAIISHPQYNEFKESLRNNIIMSPTNRKKALETLTSDPKLQQDITNNLNQCYHQNNQQGLDQAAHTIKKALEKHKLKAQPQISVNLYDTLKRVNFWRFRL